ncbi:MAG TPA: imidazolonepropionase [Bacteroidia bacterium]|nr:imidazolonepropionase [Bacteroidia bacterium]
MKLLLKNIKLLVQTEEKYREKVCGAAMQTLPCIADAWLAIENEVITGFGAMADWEGISDWSGLQVIDASDRLVMPSWCDSHTHLIYAGTRDGEFVDRIKGLSYEEIAARGGGILNSAQKLRNATEEELIKPALERLHEIMLLGTGAVEIKSGYGLSMDSELKMLRVIKKLKTLSPLTIKATFLGAHAVPVEFKGRKSDYILHLIEEIMPRIAEEQLADYCDVFCERNYFSPEETIQLLEAGKKHGMIPKVHAEQMSNSGGVLAGVQCGAISVDHLEYVAEAEIRALQNSVTMPTILPGAAFFLSLPHPPARQMIDAGLPLAIATDFNPGSCPSGNMNGMLSIACIQYRLTPEEAINASTLNSAYAMGLSASHGSIAIGKKANVFITKEIPGYSHIPYAFGSNPVETVILNGKIIKP